MDKTRMMVTLAGQEFKLAASESETYIRKLADYVNESVEEVQRTYPSLGTNSCALLAMLNMADELYKLRADYDALDQRISQLREIPARAPAATPVKRPFETRQPINSK